MSLLFAKPVLALLIIHQHLGFVRGATPAIAHQKLQTAPFLKLVYNRLLVSPKAVQGSSRRIETLPLCRNRSRNNGYGRRCTMGYIANGVSLIFYFAASIPNLVESRGDARC